MTTEQRLKKMRLFDLVEEARIYDNTCYGPNACFGVRDMIYLDMLEREIFRREEIKRKSI